MGRANAIFALLALLLLFSSLSAQCPTAKRQIYLAAVTGESSGGIFQLRVEIRPGNGTVYTAISPRTGFSTQESEMDAVQYAFASAGIDLGGCDVLFSMKGDFGDNTVDGPSAGGAMAVATKAALLNKTIRQDAAMTGTVSQEGRVGEVGGIIEKAIAAAESGARYFVVPKLKVYEALLISSVSSKYDFAAIEAGSLQDAEAVMFSNYTEEFASKFSPESKPVPLALPALPLDAQTGRFTLVAKKVVDDLDATVRTVFPGQQKNEEGARLQKYFTEELSKYRTLLSMGYPFTAANSAFLLSIDAEYAKMGGRQVDINGSFSDVQDCVGRLEKPKKTAENFHWATGSDLRRIWAAKKLNETAEERGEHGGYVTLRDLLFANSWCGISRELALQSNDIGGQEANESALAPLASRKLSDAESALASAPKPDYDALWHYESGLIANESGEYGAAIYEATYALAMQKITSGEKENSSLAAKKLSEGGRNSLWGKIYYAQGLYLYYDALENKAPANDAYRILKYSSDLDKASAEIDQELEEAQKQSAAAQAPEQKQEEPARQAREESPAILLLLALCLGLTGAAAIWRLAKMGSKISLGKPKW
jgi:hypothetical protein